MTNSFMLLIKNMLGRKLHCQKVSTLFPFHIEPAHRFASAEASAELKLAWVSRRLDLSPVRLATAYAVHF